MSDAKQEWPLFEVFIRARSGLEHKHVGSIHAVDAQHGDRARTRRLHAPPGRRQHLGRALERDHRLRSGPRQMRLFEPARDKVYRHPTFYAIPDEVKNL